MTKYVLQSGGIRSQPLLKRQFHQELVKTLGKSPRFLLCNFAQPREDWESKLEGYIDTISQDLPDVTPISELAMPATFIEQCQRAEVIYCHGGDVDLLKYWMSKFNLLELFRDKVVATSSASSMLLVTSYWTCDWRECGDGFGILPGKFIAHYQSDYGHNDPRGPVNWQQAYDELTQYGDTRLPIYALKEGEFKAFEQ